MTFHCTLFLFTICLLLNTANAQNEGWSHQFSVPGFDAPIEQIEVTPSGAAYLTGEFRAIDGERYNQIVLYRDGQFEHLPEDDIIESIHDMVLDGDTLYVAGMFKANERPEIRCLKNGRWQVVAEYPYYEGGPYYVQLAVSGNLLALSYLVSSSPGNTEVHILQNSQWNRVAKIQAYGRNLAWHENTLFFSIYRDFEGGPEWKIAKWENNAWQAVDAGLEQLGVSELMSKNGKLMITTDTSDSTSISSLSTFEWNGTSWDVFSPPVQLSNHEHFKSFDTRLDKWLICTTTRLIELKEADHDILSYPYNWITDAAYLAEDILLTGGSGQHEPGSIYLGQPENWHDITPRSNTGKGVPGDVVWEVCGDGKDIVLLNSNDPYGRWNGAAWDSFAQTVRYHQLWGSAIFKSTAVIWGERLFLGNPDGTNAQSGLFFWNDNHWRSPLDNGFSILVTALTTIDSLCYFANGEDGSVYSMRFDGSNLQPIPDSEVISGTGDISALQFHAGELYALNGLGGLLRLETGGWQELGRFENTGLRRWNARIHIIKDVIVVGSFHGVRESDGSSLPASLAIWDGTRFSPFAVMPESGFIFDTIIYKNLLIAGGIFEQIDGFPAQNIAFWDGNAWHAFGSGIEGWGVSGLHVQNDTLYAAGDFHFAGGKPSRNFATFDLKQLTGEVSGEPKEVPPTTITLRQNYPNPFNPSTQISYNLSNASNVELTIYNIQGQKVKILLNKFQIAGEKTIVWDGKDNSGTAVTSGVYIYHLRTGGSHETKKMILMR